MLLLDHVSGAGNHEGRHGKVGKIGRVDMRFLGHEAHKLVFPLRVGILVGRVATVCLVLRANAFAQAGFDALWEQVGAVEHHALDAIGVLKREQERNDAAVREAEEVRSRKFEFVQEVFEIAGELRERERRVAARRRAVSARLLTNSSNYIRKAAVRRAIASMRL